MNTSSLRDDVQCKGRDISSSASTPIVVAMVVFLVCEPSSLSENQFTGCDQ